MEFPNHKRKPNHNYNPYSCLTMERLGLGIRLRSGSEAFSHFNQIKGVTMNRVISRTNIVILATTLQLAVSYGQSLPDQPGTSPAANPFGQTTATPQTRTEVPANSYPGPAGEYANALDAFTGTFYPSQGTPRAGGRALVVRSSEGEVGRDLEMDLTVMSHILGNVVREEAGVSARPQTAMGIDVYFPADGNGIRSLYLEG